MNMLSICPYLRYAETIPCVIEGITFRRTYDARLFYFLEGSGVLFAEGKQYALSAGAAVYVPTGTEYNIEGVLKAITLNFDLTDAAYGEKSKSPCASNSFDEREIFDKTEPPNELKNVKYSNSCVNLLEKFRECTYYKSLNKPSYDAAASGKVKEILALLVESDGQKEISIESKVMLYIKQNYDKPISNEELSKAFGYHPYHLNKLFKKKYGITVHQAVLNERISIAKQLLARTDLSVDGIAEIVGFSERVAFYCAFKKSEGISPNEYRTSTAADK